MHWAPEPTVTLRTGNAGCVWGWCTNKRAFIVVKAGQIHGDFKIDADAGLRTRAETCCPGFVRKEPVQSNR